MILAGTDELGYLLSKEPEIERLGGAPPALASIRGWRGGLSRASCAHGPARRRRFLDSPSAWSILAVTLLRAPLGRHAPGRRAPRSASAAASSRCWPCPSSRTFLRERRSRPCGRSSCSAGSCWRSASARPSVRRSGRRVPVRLGERRPERRRPDRRRRRSGSPRRSSSSGSSAASSPSGPCRASPSWPARRPPSERLTGVLPPADRGRRRARRPARRDGPARRLRRVRAAARARGRPPGRSRRPRHRRRGGSRARSRCSAGDLRLSARSGPASSSAAGTS